MSKVDMGRVTSSRRQFLTASGVGVVGIAGCLGDNTEDDGNVEPTEDDPLVVAITGGPFKEVYDVELVDAFREETDIPIESTEMENPPTAFSEFQRAHQQGEAPADLFLNTAVTSLRGKEEDMWEQWDADEFENLQYYDDQYIERQDGQVVAVPDQGWYTTLSHNTELLGDNQPDSWTALWDSTYEDAFGVNRMVDTNFLLEITAEVHFDGQEKLETDEGIEEVLEVVDDVRPQVSVWYDTGAQFLQDLADGQYEAGQNYHDVAHFMSEDGEPVESIFPEEGAVIDFGHFSMFNTSRKREAAREFLDFQMRPDIQDNVSRELFTVPLTDSEHSDIEDELYEVIAGPGPEAAISPKFDLYVGERSEFIYERWDEFMLE